VDDRGSILLFLQQGRWFGALAPALQQLIVQRSIVVRFEPGDYLIEEGSQPKGLYAVLEGRVRAVRRLADGRDAPVHVGGKGFWWGDYATLAGQPSIGSAIAETRVRTLFLSAAEFERIVDEEPRYYRAFMELLLERYARVFGSVAELHGLPSEERLRRRLESIAALWRDDVPTSGPVDIPLSQLELASMVGLSRQRLSTLLGRLEAQGLIEAGFRSIRVLG
jgi:CRP/FNR family transcriptional regulator, cyclic AMP receptor protein